MERIIVGGTYRHYKKGHVYKVIAVGRHSETLEDVVIYQAENRESACAGGAYDTIWVRPAAMWNENVATPDGIVPRFALVED